jgi:hypothetical protein
MDLAAVQLNDLLGEQQANAIALGVFLIVTPVKGPKYKGQISPGIPMP